MSDRLGIRDAVGIQLFLIHLKSISLSCVTINQRPADNEFGHGLSRRLRVWLINENHKVEQIGSICACYAIFIYIVGNPRLRRFY